jgi:hypothetical protein
MGGIFSSPPNQKIAPTDFDSSNIGRGVDMDANMGDKEVKIKSLPASKYTTESNVSQTDANATPNTSTNTKSEDKEEDGVEGASMFNYMDVASLFYQFSQEMSVYLNEENMAKLTPSTFVDNNEDIYSAGNKMYGSKVTIRGSSLFFVEVNDDLLGKYAIHNLPLTKKGQREIGPEIKHRLFHSLYYCFGAHRAHEKAKEKEKNNSTMKATPQGLSHISCPTLGGKQIFLPTTTLFKLVQAYTQLVPLVLSPRSSSASTIEIENATAVQYEKFLAMGHSLLTLLISSLYNDMHKDGDNKGVGNSPSKDNRGVTKGSFHISYERQSSPSKKGDVDYSHLSITEMQELARKKNSTHHGMKATVHHEDSSKGGDSRSSNHIDEDEMQSDLVKGTVRSMTPYYLILVEIITTMTITYITSFSTCF